MKEERPITQYPQPTEREHNPPTTEQVLSCVRNVGPTVLDRMLSAQLAQQRAKYQTELSSTPTEVPQAVAEAPTGVTHLYESMGVESPLRI
jgi:hypothetical protein